MIRVDKGVIEIKGNKNQLYHEACMLFYRLAQQEIMDRDTMHTVVETCFMSEEEMIDMVREIINGKEEKTAEDEVMSKILDTMDELLNTIKRNDK